MYFTPSAERDHASAGEKVARKTSLAGGARFDLEKAAQKQQIKLQEQMERILTSVKATHEGRRTKDNNSSAAGERSTTGGTGRKQQAHIRSAQTEPNRLAGTIHLCQGVNAVFSVKQNTHLNATDMNGEDPPEEKTSTGSGNGLIHKQLSPVTENQETTENSSHQCVFTTLMEN